VSIYDFKIIQRIRISDSEWCSGYGIGYDIANSVQIWIIQNLIRKFEGFKPDNAIFESKAKANLTRLVVIELPNSFGGHV
jgi:hypothetical protein